MPYLDDEDLLDYAPGGRLWGSVGIFGEHLTSPGRDLLLVEEDGPTDSLLGSHDQKVGDIITSVGGNPSA